LKMTGNICDSCSRLIKKRQKYSLRIQIYAAAEVELDAEDLAADHKKAMQKICEKLKNADAKKLEEDVYVCYDLTLCKRCRDVFSERIKHREFI